MNILHMKYAVEVAKAGSINKASETLLIAQPNLSRSIKELETDLGITIFDRSAKGMFLTPEGREFIGYAQKILKQIDDVENIYKSGSVIRQKFSISVPRATYISEAFGAFSKNISSSPADIYYKETNSSRTLKNVISSDYKLGIVRYAENYDKYFESMFDEKSLTYETVAEFKHLFIMHKSSPLAKKEKLCFEDLRPYIELVYGDPFVPYLPSAEVKKQEFPKDIERRIFVFERSSRFDLLCQNNETFMRACPLNESTLNRYGLVQKECADVKKVYRDVLIHKKDYKLSMLDEMFIKELKSAKEKYL